MYLNIARNKIEPTIKIYFEFEIYFVVSNDKNRIRYNRYFGKDGLVQIFNNRWYCDLNARWTYYGKNVISNQKMMIEFKLRFL